MSADLGSGWLRRSSGSLAKWCSFPSHLDFACKVGSFIAGSSLATIVFSVFGSTPRSNIGSRYSDLPPPDEPRRTSIPHSDYPLRYSLLFSFRKKGRAPSPKLGTNHARPFDAVCEEAEKKSQPFTLMVTGSESSNLTGVSASVCCLSLLARTQPSS